MRYSVEFDGISAGKKKTMMMIMSGLIARGIIASAVEMIVLILEIKTFWGGSSIFLSIGIEKGVDLYRISIC